MEDQNPISYAAPIESDQAEPGGVLQRALYLWERQPPSPARQAQAEAPAQIPAENLVRETPEPQPVEAARSASSEIDMAIEEQLKRHAGRLAALESLIPNDRRLDPPRFSLMMLNAFLGRAVTEGIVSARLPGLLSICEQIDAELADLELEYPAALERKEDETGKFPIQIRDEMRAHFTELKSIQKAQQRQIVTSLTALHTTMAELRTRFPEAKTELPPAVVPPHHDKPNAAIDEFARPFINPERLVDPRPVLAAARAAASQAIREVAETPRHEAKTCSPLTPVERPHRTVLLGTAILGLMMILFGREAVQFLSASPLAAGALSRP